MNKTRWHLTGALSLALFMAACATTGAPPARGPNGEGIGASPEVPAEAAVPLSDVRSAEEPRIAVGGPAIEISGTSTTGEVVRLSQYREKKIVILQFLGLRCSPCVAEIAFLSDLQRENQESMQVIGINTDRMSVDALRRALEAHHIEASYPVIADTEFDICRSYTQWLIPLTVFVDRAQKVRAIRTGFSETLKAEMRVELERLISEDR